MSNHRAFEVLEEALRTAMLSSDVAKLDDLLEDELLFIGPDGGIVSKAEDLARYRVGDQRITTIEPKETLVRVETDVAFVSVLALVCGTFKGQSFRGNFRYLRVWRQSTTGWKVAAGSVTALGGPVSSSPEPVTRVASP